MKYKTSGSTVTNYVLNEEDSTPGRDRIFSLYHQIETGSGARKMSNFLSQWHCGLSMTVS
jgi:hypothetical protein